MPVISAQGKKAARKTTINKKAVNTKVDITAGYNQFKNYEDRGDQFKAWVRKLSLK